MDVVRSDMGKDRTTQQNRGIRLLRWKEPFGLRPLMRVDMSIGSPPNG